MSTLTTIAASDIISASRSVINSNFAALNADKVDVASTYADPPWLTSIAGSKVTGNIPGGAATATLAAAATALATPRTIAGVNFDGTANISIASTGLSDSSSLVRGAAALSTAGQVPFVSATGALGASSNLFWDNGNGRLGVGTNTPVSVLSVAGSGAEVRFRAQNTSPTGEASQFVFNAGSGYLGMQLYGASAGGNTYGITNASLAKLSSNGANLTIGTEAASPLVFVTNSTERARFFATTGNFGIGASVDDGASRLQVVNSSTGFPLIQRWINSLATSANWSVMVPGSASGVGRDSNWELLNNGNVPILRVFQNGSVVMGPGNHPTTATPGTLFVHDGTATTGSTSLIVRAGAGQVGNLTTWQNASGGTVASIGSTGAGSFPAVSNTGGTWSLGGSWQFGSGLVIGWGSSAGFSAPDAAFARNAAGVVEVNSGTAGQFRDLRVRDLFQNGTANTAVFGGQNVATGQVLYGTAAGVAGSEAAFAYDAANNRLGIGGASSHGLTIRSNDDSISFGTTGVERGQITYASTNAGIGASTGQFRMWANGSGIGSPAATIATTGNLLLNTTTDDGNNRLQVAGSVRIALTAAQSGLQVVNGSTFSSMDIIGATEGNIALQDTGAAANQQVFNLNVNDGALSFRLLNDNRTGVNGVFGRLSANGEWRFHDERATVGSTSLVVRAGAGQSTNNLQTWQNSAGTAQARVLPAGGIESVAYLAIASSTAFSGYRAVLGPSALEMQSGGFLAFSSTTEATATKDTALARNAAGVIEINSGTAGTFRDLYLRGVRAVGVTVANLPPASANTGMRCTVTDATATTIGTTVAGGGANTVLVWSNGTNWRIYAN